MSMIGKTLGNFECTSLLGKGGMGEVYRAKDQKLGRHVAIKVLPEEFAKDADRVARFQREAKLLASLNHPNIAAIHGLEESDGTHFLVLELIEGDTLADRLKHGAIAVEEALKLALQIAEALEAAHEKGVIHRDLKPANIKVTPDGKVKVLDFGLAKAFAGEQAEANLSHSPTLSEAATLQGVILGTAAYMSPEQARGKPVDNRTDIWAFGCVLYEILTGQAAFQGEDVTEILAAVVKSGVNLDLLPINIHPDIGKLINRCLQKEQKRRYSTISDAQYEIEQVLADPSGVFVQPVTEAKPKKKLRVGIPWVIAAVVLTAIIAVLAGLYLKPAEPSRVVRFDYELPENQDFAVNAAGVVPFAVAPDGSHFIYGTSEGLYLRSMDELDARLIPETAGAFDPFFSPDGKWVGYCSSTDMKLKKVAVSGGAPISLCQLTVFSNAKWNKDRTIVFGAQDQGIMRVSADGGTAEKIIEAKGGIYFDPQIIADGKSVIFARMESGVVKIFAQSLESSEPKELIEGDTALYLPSGYLAYQLNDDVFAAPFDPDKLEVTGGPVSMIEDVWQFSVSDEGTLVYMPRFLYTSGSSRSLVWVDREGNEEMLSAPTADYGDPKISPDGTKVALAVQTDQNEDIWIWDLVRKNRTRLTFDDASDEAPLWTPDGKRIVFTSDRRNGSGFFWKAADGSGGDEPLGAESDVSIIPASWSRDGKALVVNTARGNYDIRIMSMDGEHETKMLLQEEYHERQPQISPDGQWIAYSSNESGAYEIYARPFPNVDGGRWQVSTSGGTSPLWSPDSKELFYRNGESVMAVAVEMEPNLRFGTPKELFRGKYLFPLDADLSQQTMWDIHPDGKRFLMIKTFTTESTEGAQRPKINIVLNWFEELKERVRVD